MTLSLHAISFRRIAHATIHASLWLVGITALFIVF